MADTNESISRHQQKGEEAAATLQNELVNDRRQYLTQKGATPEQAEQGAGSATAYLQMLDQLKTK